MIVAEKTRVVAVPPSSTVTHALDLASERSLCGRDAAWWTVKASRPVTCLICTAELVRAIAKEENA